VKDLIGLDFRNKQTTGELCNRAKKLIIHESMKLDILLNQFLQSKLHIALVMDEFGNFIGIVTLEDVIEEIINVEIVDEADEIIDMQKLAKELYMKKYEK
jgi:metal transporter CNNM